MSEFTFKDAKQGEWDLKLNLGLAKRIDASDFSQLSKLQFSFIAPTPEFFGEIYSNVSFAMALVWAIVQDQVEKVMAVSIHPAPPIVPRLDVTNYVSPDEAETLFLERLDGDAIRNGKEALLKAMADFFPDHRTVLLSLGQKFQKMQARLNLEMMHMDNKIDELIEEQMDEAVTEFRKRASNLGMQLGDQSTLPSAPSAGSPTISPPSPSRSS